MKMSVGWLLIMAFTLALPPGAGLAAAPEEGATPTGTRLAPAERREPPLAVEDPSAQDATGAPVILDGWSFLHIDLSTADVFYQSEIAPETVRRMVVSIEIASMGVPAALGVSDQKRNYYLFASGDAFRSALRDFARVPENEISGLGTGHAWPRPPRPGTYYNAGALEQEGDALWTVAHELTHLVAVDVARRRDYPQWFHEGLAEFIAGEVVRTRYAQYSTREAFLSGARLANAARAGALPSLAPLVSTPQWVAATAKDWNLHYDSAAQAVAQLVERGGRDAVVQTLTAVGAGGAFDRAFVQAFGMAVAEIDAVLALAASGLDTQFPPGVLADRDELPASERIQIVFLGGRPAEVIQWSFSGPGSCRGAGSTTATPAGFASYFFYLRESSWDSCAGRWKLSAEGDQGSVGQYGFTFTRASAP